ncbi:MAG TPA: response regulator transcription factor [Terriglobia bacterium]|nr:response regulator transcription factor [Terriglobia bacterium]
MLSSHPMVLAELERILAPAGFKVQARRLESVLASGVGRLSLPRAQVFVTDAHAPHQATEVLVAGIQERYPHARQVVVAEKFSEVSAFPLLRLGAKGLLCYTEARERLAEALQAVAAGGFWVPRDLLSRFIDTNLGAMRGRRVKLSPANITLREREVLDALLENLANKEIGDRLNISERTVKFHVSSLLEKFSVRRRADLMLLCLQEHAPGP